MRFRNKLFLSFTSVAVISSFTALSLFFIKTKELIFLQLRSQIYSVGVAYADSLDGNYLETINSLAATQTPSYERLITTLRDFRNINRRSDFYLSYVCLFKRTPSGKLIYIADAEQNPELVSRYGDPVTFDPNERDWNQKEAYVDTKESIDQWGHWISGFFPITNTQGNIVAFLELDLYFSAFLNKLYLLTLYGLLGFILSVGLGFFIAIFFAKKLSRAISVICQTVDKIGAGDFSAKIHLHTHDEMDLLAEKINEMGKNLEEKERIKSSFGKYVSNYVLEKILSSESAAKLGGEKRKVTVLFSDIRNFTSLSEHLAPEELVAFLNEYFETMIEIIFKHQGTLDKFIGDGMMVEFGAPLDDSKQECNAVLAAKEMLQAVQSLREKWKDKLYKDIQIGIGIHTGEAVVGNIGSSKRMEYTAIGDAVNVASRLEHLTRERGLELIISEKTYQEAKALEDTAFTSIGPVILKGREEPLVAYTIKV